MTEPEFSRPLDVRQAEGLSSHLVAAPAEREALTRRFGLVRIDRLEARLDLTRDGRVVLATGTLDADLVQSCAVSGDDLAVAIREPLSFRFVPAAAHRPSADEEVELSAEDCDEIEYEGSHFDPGEAVAQSLALAIDPFLTGPNADEARRRAGLLDEEASGPFAALKGLVGKGD